MTIFSNPKVILTILILVGFALSTFKINQVPPGVSHDELEYINNGYSIYQTGRDLYGSFLPISIGGVGYVAIPAYFAGLSTYLFGLDEWSARLFPIIFSLIEIYLIYGIAKILFKSDRIALAAAFILTTSTWGLLVSRVMLDSTTALFLYMLGIYLFLKAKSIKLLIIGLITICLGTLSYYGALFIAPFIITLLIIHRFKLIQTKKHYFFLYALIVLLITGFILGIMLFQPGQNTRSLGRSNELIIFNNEEITNRVVFDRSRSTGSELATNLLINKFTIVWKWFFVNYFQAFSPQMIFVEGDSNANYGLWGRGELGVLDFPLFLLGLFYLYRKNKNSLKFVGAVILVAPLTSGLTGTVYATRAFLMWPFMMIVAGSGILALWDWVRSANKINFRAVFFVLFWVIYLCFFTTKLHQYYYRYPIYSKEAWFDSEKQLAHYLMDRPDEKITVYSLEGREMFMEYLFYSKFDPALAQKALLNNDVTRVDITLNNTRFIDGCFDPGQDSFDHKIIVHTHCTPLDIKLADEVIKTQDGDNRVKWAIYTPK